MNTYFVLFNRNNKFYFLSKMYNIVAKKFKVHIHTVQITNYILNDILSNFMVNRKVKHKNVVRGKNGICCPTLTLGCSIRNKISTQRPIGKLNFLDGQ
jgi:ABC-type tungstate transport system substrate-binding protein